MLKQLLDGGANPNIQNRFRRTALSHHLENLENVKLLLQYDADPDIEDFEGIRCRGNASHEVERKSITKYI